MSTDTENFLEALLWVAYSPDRPETKHIANWTIHEFHPEFQQAVAGFCQGFREALTLAADKLTEAPDSEFDEELWEICAILDNPDAGERSFGGNVFFSLSGHGVGFWDDRDAARGKVLQAALESYSGGNRHRFEGIESMLSKFNGKIHLSYRTAAFRREALHKLFAVSPQPAAANP